MGNIDNITFAIIMAWLATMFALYTVASIYHVSPPVAGGSIALGVVAGVLAVVARYHSGGGNGHNGS